jgi:hypothetical protein
VWLFKRKETTKATDSQSAWNATLWVGRNISGLVALFLVFDGATKILKLANVVEASEKLGVPSHTIVGIGITLLACTTIYSIPQTAVLGAILLTGYLGGATAIHVRAGSGVFPIVFSIAFGALVWGGLILREPKLLWTIVLRR